MDGMTLDTRILKAVAGILLAFGAIAGVGNAQEVCKEEDRLCPDGQAQCPYEERRCPKCMPYEPAEDLLVPVDIDETGISNWRYLNKRRPFPLAVLAEEREMQRNITRAKAPIKKLTSDTAAEQAEKDKNNKIISDCWHDYARRKPTIRFNNVTSSRAYIVEIDYKPGNDVPRMSKRQPGLDLDKRDGCKKPDKDGKRNCTYSRTLFSSIYHDLKGEDLERIIAGSDKVVKFTVSFYDGVGTPTNSTGYLRAKVGELTEDSETSWSVKASISYKEDPEVDSDPNDKVREVFSRDNPVVGADLSRFQGSAQLDLSQTLTNLAQADVTLRFKSGDLGKKDEENEVTVSTYKVDIFGYTGLSLRFGKFGFASPAESIAIRESGEGFQYNYRGLSLGYIAKRESLTGLADNDNDDSQVFIFQHKTGTFLGLGLHGSVFALYGEENKENQRPYDYKTYGGEFSGAWSGVDRNDTEGWTFGFKGAFFASDRDVDTDFVHDPGPDPENPVAFTEVVPGKGDVGLVEVTATFFATAENRPYARGPSAGEKPPPEFKDHRSFSLKWGRGTGDDPGTAERDEGYLGETAAFAPDRLFLSTFASRTSDRKTAVFPQIADLPAYANVATDDDPLVSVIGPGLSNKQYLGITYTEKRLAKYTNILGAIARGLGLADDIESESMIVRFHKYRFVRDVFSSRDAGEEYSVEWNIESPKGVTTTFYAAKFYPGSALEPVFKTDPTTFGASLSLTLK